MFRGDAVRDEENQAAVVDDIAASAPTSLGGLNLLVAYGLLDGNETTTSDCIKAHVQSILSSSQSGTMLSISISLALRSLKHCTAIHWPACLGRTISPKSLHEELGGLNLSSYQSCFYFPSLRLALSVYGDDLTLSGPRANDAKFWDVLRQVVQLEDPAPHSTVLGRGHVKHDGGLALHPADFARQCVTLFQQTCQACSHSPCG